MTEGEGGRDSRRSFQEHPPEPLNRTGLRRESQRLCHHGSPHHYPWPQKYAASTIYTHKQMLCASVCLFSSASRGGAWRLELGSHAHSAAPRKLMTSSSGFCVGDINSQQMLARGTVLNWSKVIDGYKNLIPFPPGHTASCVACLSILCS